MLMTNFLKDRESIRDFKKTKVSEGSLDEIKLAISEIKKEAKEGLFEIKVYENGANIFKGFEGKAGYSNVMIESPHYISLIIKEKTDEALIYGAYGIEKLITELHEMDIATCWITLDSVEQNDKIEVLGSEYADAEYLIAIGYSKPRNPFLKESFSSRKSIEDLVFQDEIGKKVDIEFLEERGLLDLFYYVRYAPSTKNLQPWRFLIKGNTIELLMEEDSVNYADAGIMMYYFEALASIANIKSKWELTKDEKEAGYNRIATLQL